MKRKSQLIECVPNFSEGRNPKIIDAIVTAIKSIRGVKVFHVDMGFDVHRTVITFIGKPENVCKAAFRAIQTASKLIDMRLHTGIHPRIGSTDVCPLVPIKDISLEETAEYARQLAHRVGEELKIPVYCYEAAATTDSRKNLADIRKLQYEGLAQMLTDPKWQPDFYPYFNAQSGATIIGARPLLIAFNVNLNTTDVRIAKKLATLVRQKPSKENPEGGFKAVKAIGWYVEEYNCAQVSINFVDATKTSVVTVYNFLKDAARNLGFEITGSELIGLISELQLLIAANQNQSAPEKNKIDQLNIGAELLGLNALEPFDTSKRVIELLIKSGFHQPKLRKPQDRFLSLEG